MMISKRIKIGNIQRLFVAVQKLRRAMEEKETFWRHPHAVRPYKGFGQFSIVLKSFMASDHKSVFVEEEKYYKAELYAFYSRIRTDPDRPRKIGTALQHYLPQEYNHVMQLLQEEFRRLADVDLDFSKD